MIRAFSSQSCWLEYLPQYFALLSNQDEITILNQLTKLTLF